MIRVACAATRPAPFFPLHKKQDKAMLFIGDIFRWSLPLFWLAVGSAAFFTAHIMRVEEAAALLPLGTAAIILSATTAGLSLIWKA